MTAPLRTRLASACRNRRLQRQQLPIYRRRLRVLNGTLTTATCCYSLRIALCLRKRLEFAFVSTWRTARTSSTCVGARATAGPASSSRGSARTKPRKYVVLIFFSNDKDYTAFKTGLITLFGRLEFEHSYRQQLRELAQTGSESIASYAARTTDLTTRAYSKFSTENKLDIAVVHFIARLRDTSTRDYLRCERARRSITWEEAFQMAQACKLTRASDRSSSHAPIASHTSNATFTNSAQSSTTSGNNCAITTPCATGNSGNTRRRQKYSSSLRAPQGDWRAANPINTTTPQASAWNFDPWKGAPYSANANQFERTRSIPQLPLVPNKFNQQPNQHNPRPQFQHPRKQRAPYTVSQTNLYAVPPLISTFANPQQLTYEQQQPPSQQSNRSSSNVHAVEFARRNAPQVLAAVKLNDVQIDGTLIDSGSSFSLIASPTLAALPERPSVKQFMHRPPKIVGVGGSSAIVLGYVDVAVVISDVEVRNPLIVVNKLAYPLLIGTDVVRPHSAIFELGTPDVVRLKLDRCSVCIKKRLPDATPHVIVKAIASTLADTTLPPHTASRVQVRLPFKVLGDSHFLVEQLPHELATAACAALPSICAIVGATHVLFVVNMSDKQM